MILNDDLKKYKDIYFRDWITENSNINILAIHGLGAHSGWFSNMGLYLNKNNINLYAIELKGFGKNIEGKQGFVKHIREYHFAIKKLKEYILKNKSEKVILLGESMGGLLATTHILKYDSEYSKIISISPAYKDILKFNLLKRIQIFLYSIFKKDKEIKMPFSNNDITKDGEILKELNNDYLTHKFASANLLKQLLFEQIYIAINIQKLKIPILLLLAENDLLIDIHYAGKIIKRVKDNKNIITYKNTYHSLIMDEIREKVYEDIVMFCKN